MWYLCLNIHVGWELPSELTNPPLILPEEPEGIFIFFKELCMYKLFADDLIHYHKISIRGDRKILQDDLDNLTLWDDK